MKNYLFIVLLAVLAACGGSDQPAEEVKKDEPLAQSKNSSRFNQTFGDFLNNYYSLKDALVASNPEQATTAANNMVSSANNIAYDEMKADSNIVLTAKDFTNTITGDAQKLATEADLEAKRKTFQSISDNMYTLLRTVRYDNEIVYQQYCPMAFDDAGAAWLSKTSDIKNPYYGKKMLTCGEVRDSLDFRGK
ncbi:DUF3347 domain-containing protein [Aridibaculum aurantiacum]|uniref:DUF3347 domain-containing protein n=1 Tax=Aridibaculum aurantiacum TaxID=2810307 RepID=UPI001A96BC74|nr:DUF3347 domain-containing protein [Aridibaculum aurantiacum]